MYTLYTFKHIGNFHGGRWGSVRQPRSFSPISRCQFKSNIWPHGCSCFTGATFGETAPSLLCFYWRGMRQYKAPWQTTNSGTWLQRHSSFDVLRESRVSPNKIKHTSRAVLEHNETLSWYCVIFTEYICRPIWHSKKYLSQYDRTFSRSKQRRFLKFLDQICPITFANLFFLSFEMKPERILHVLIWSENFFF